MVTACPAHLGQEDPSRAVLRIGKAVLEPPRVGNKVERYPGGLEVHSKQQQYLVTAWSQRPGQENLPCHPAHSPQAPSSCCPRGPAPHGWCCLKEMSGAPEKVLRNLSPRISWLEGVIKACLQGLFLALKSLLVLPGLSKAEQASAQQSASDFGDPPLFLGVRL